jgi:O-methyltransferase
MDRNRFLSQTTNIGVDTYQNRSNLLDRFDFVHSEASGVRCEHSFADAYYMADYILKNQFLPGNLAEFGCFQGGMTIKLSHVAKLLGKKLFVFDTFEGLPESADYQLHDGENLYRSDGTKGSEFYKNQFACSLGQVKSNITTHGCIDSCVFVKGLLEETLPLFHAELCFIFIDVDLIEPARFVVKQLWNKITGHGIFTHEACVVEYMRAICCKKWWRENFSQYPPSLASQKMQYGYGLFSSHCLDFLFKKEIDQGVFH